MREAEWESGGCSIGGDVESVERGYWYVRTVYVVMFLNSTLLVRLCCAHLEVGLEKGLVQKTANKQVY